MDGVGRARVEHVFGTSVTYPSHAAAAGTSVCVAITIVVCHFTAFAAAASASAYDAVCGVGLVRAARGLLIVTALTGTARTGALVERCRNFISIPIPFRHLCEGRW